MRRDATGDSLGRRLGSGRFVKRIASADGAPGGRVSSRFVRFGAAEGLHIWIIVGHHAPNLDQSEKHGRDRGHLCGSPSRQIRDEFNKPSPFRCGRSKARQESLFKSVVRFFFGEVFFEQCVHSFLFLVQLAALRAFHQMTVQGLALGLAEFVVQISGEQRVDVLMDRAHKVR